MLTFCISIFIKLQLDDARTRLGWGEGAKPGLVTSDLAEAAPLAIPCSPPPRAPHSLEPAEQWGDIGSRCHHHHRQWARPMRPWPSHRINAPEPDPTGVEQLRRPHIHVAIPGDPATAWCFLDGHVALPCGGGQGSHGRRGGGGSLHVKHHWHGIRQLAQGGLWHLHGRWRAQGTMAQMSHPWTNVVAFWTKSRHK